MAPLKPLSRYDAVAKTLHWLIALAIIGMLALGWIMEGLPSEPRKFALFQLHKSIGITILVLSLLRLAWRFTHKPPPLPKTMPNWERWAARTSHWLFYVLIIGMPLTGWAIVSSSPFNLPTMLFGKLPLPNLPVLPTLANKKEIGHMIAGWHALGGYTMAALLVLHVAAAHKHHWLDRDDVLVRMTPNPISRFLLRLRGEK